MEHTKEEYKYHQVAIRENQADETDNLFPSVKYEIQANGSNKSATIVDVKHYGKPSRRFLYLAACIGNLTTFICGTTFGWTSPEVPKFMATNNNPLDTPLTSQQEGWVCSLLPLAASIGPFVGGFLVDRIGRKTTLLASAVPFIVAFCLNVIATNATYLYVSRFLCGFSVGSTFAVIPMFIGEISDDEVRGSVGSLLQFFMVAGIFYSFILGPYLSIKTFNILLIFPPVLFIVIFFCFVPESPYYLVKIGKVDRAEEALKKFRGKTNIEEDIDNIRRQVNLDSKTKGNFFDLFKTRGLTKALCLTLSLVTLQQFSGINIILFYAQDIFDKAGVNLPAEICAIIIVVVQIAPSSITPMLEHKWGKRLLLILSAIGMASAQAILAFFFHLQENKKDISYITWLPIACLVLYIISYCLGFGPLPWAVMGELFPGYIKPIASSLTASGCYILGFVLTNYFRPVTDTIGKTGTYGLFSGCCFVAAVFVYKFLPETTGKSLQEIQDILNGKSRSKA